MNNENNYISGLFGGLKTLRIGLKTTMREFFTKKITEQYPENRNELQMFERFRGSLTMPHNEKNEHKCIGCGLCQMACPNGTITVAKEFYEDEDGKKKFRLGKYEYNLGACMFCMLCVKACPQGAITFDQSFENAVFDRTKLVKVLNHPGSRVVEKKRPAVVAKPATPVAAKAAAAPAVAPAAKPAATTNAPTSNGKPSTPIEKPSAEKPIAPATETPNA